MARGYKPNRMQLTQQTVVADSVGQGATADATQPVVIAPTEHQKVCPGCSKTIESYGQCPHGCGYLSRNSKLRDGKQRVEGEKYKDLSALSDWRYDPNEKAADRVKTIHFVDEVEGFSLLYTQFQNRIALPSEIAYYVDLENELLAAGDKVAEYVAVKIATDEFVGSAQEIGVNAALAALIKLCGSKEALAAAMANQGGASNVVATAIEAVATVGS